MLQDSPRGIRPLQSLNPGQCKTSTATASHTSATLKKKKSDVIHENTSGTFESDAGRVNKVSKLNFFKKELLTRLSSRRIPPPESDCVLIVLTFSLISFSGNDGSWQREQNQSPLKTESRHSTQILASRDRHSNL